MNRPSIRVGLNVMKTHGRGLSTAILSLAMLAGMSACQSEQSSPGASDALPQAQVLEMSPREQMIHRRAVEAAVWGMPIEGTRGLLLGARKDVGGDWNDVIYFSKPMESRHGFLTANNQVPYVIASLNTKDGPLVVEVPGASDKAKYFGSLVDVWDYPFTDVGPAGADKGEGGKYLLLPPGYEGEVPDGYLVFRPYRYAVHAALRPVAEPGATLEDQVAYAKTLKVYRLSEASSPPERANLDHYATFMSTPMVRWISTLPPVRQKVRSRTGFLLARNSGCAFDSTGQKSRYSISPGVSRIL